LEVQYARGRVMAPVPWEGTPCLARSQAFAIRRSGRHSRRKEVCRVPRASRPLGGAQALRQRDIPGGGQGKTRRIRGRRSAGADAVRPIAQSEHGMPRDCLRLARSICRRKASRFLFQNEPLRESSTRSSTGNGGILIGGLLSACALWKEIDTETIPGYRNFAN
jgi:hypothetical protein